MTFTKQFGLNKSQSELDFVDIYLESDLLLFLDPYSISKYEIPLYKEAHNSLCDFFDILKGKIIKNNKTDALDLLSFLKEPNEIHLGLSDQSKGRGIGNTQAKLLYRKFSKSEALSKGYIESLAKSELFIDGIGPDKISDITTNVIKKQLIAYTQRQCHNYGIKMKNVSSGFFWDQTAHDWVDDYVDLPTYNDKRIILVPKRIARTSTSYDPHSYYNHYVLNFLQLKYSPEKSLGKALKKGKKPITKGELKGIYPYSKDFLFDFSIKNPGVLKHFEEDIERAVKKPIKTSYNIYKTEDQKRMTTIPDYASQLDNITSGKKGANKFHNLIFDILNYLFGTVLLYPKKEEKINAGRKRIDISYNNGDYEYFFYKLREVYKLYCPYIFFECKNYKSDIENPEFDQMAGRLSPKKSMFGIIICRIIDDREKLLKTQQDFYSDESKVILLFNDDDIKQLLVNNKKGGLKALEPLLESKMRDIVLKK